MELKEAIKTLENLKINTIEAVNCALASGTDKKIWRNEAEAIETVLAEIVRLEEENEKVKMCIQDVMYERDNSISNEKIKAKIEEIKQHSEWFEHDYEQERILDLIEAGLVEKVEEV